MVGAMGSRIERDHARWRRVVHMIEYAEFDTGTYPEKRLKLKPSSQSVASNG
jgi:hypothetical protein